MSHSMKRSVFFLFAAVVLAAAGPVAETARGEPLQGWPALQRGGFIVLIRHALAPGNGDPPHFRLDDCTTQRNLSEEGRRQARDIGDSFRRRQIPLEAVYSSQWCRCKETARLAFGEFHELAALNSFFGRYEREASQTKSVLEFLTHHPPGRGNLILVTHQVNISALTGVYPSQGEIIVTALQGSQLEVVTRLSIDEGM